MNHLAIVVRDDAYDRLLTPLTFAYVQAAKGVKVDILFVLWAVRVLTQAGVDSLKVDAGHAHEAKFLQEQLVAEGAPTEIRDYLRLLHRTGNVSLYACSLAAGTFGVVPDELLPEASGIVSSDWFLNEKAMTADHCQYF